MHHGIYFVHASYSFCSIYFCANLQSALGFVFFSFLFVVCFGPYPSTMPRKKLNSKLKIWAERFMILNEVDLAIRANLESRGWLSLLEIDHPPPTALIREFFSNLSCHIYDSNALVRSWR